MTLLIAFVLIGIGAACFCYAQSIGVTIPNTRSATTMGRSSRSAVCASFDARDVRLANAVAFGQNGLPVCAGADCRDIFVGQPTIPVIRRVVVAALIRRIGVVLGFGSKLQVRRVHAGRIIASVHDHHAVRDWPLGPLKSVSVRANPPLPRHLKNSIAVGVPVCRPFPAPVCFVDPGVEGVFRPQNRVLGQRPSPPRAAITNLAKLPANRWNRTAHNARKNRSCLIAHRRTPLINKEYAFSIGEASFVV